MAELERILQSPNMPDIRIRFALGEAISDKDLAVVPALIQTHGDLANICFNIEADQYGLPNEAKAQKAAEIVKKIGASTPNGEGNFNFSANFNCPSYIPYFPPSYHRGENGNCFAIGFETPDLLVEALKTVNKKEYKNQNEAWAAAFEIMKSALQYHIDVVTKKTRKCARQQGLNFIGVDSSAAPAPDCSSIQDIYKLLGVKHFGAPGTLSASAFLTQVFKSIKDVDLIGFSGLMLAVTEDEGLSAGTAVGNFTITDLINNSAVCGIGLDTVPIPGETSVEDITQMMLDTGTMAYRLKKPLMVRLFPVPGLAAGDMTQFSSDDLCNCRVLKP